MLFNREITKDLPRAKKFFEDILSYTMGAYCLDKIIKEETNSINIVDVREYDDYIESHIPYAVHIPFKDAQNHIDMLEKDKITLVYTYNDNCPRAYKVALDLIEKHYPVEVLRGGFAKWQKLNFDTIKLDSETHIQTEDCCCDD